MLTVVGLDDFFRIKKRRKNAEKIEFGMVRVKQGMENF
jgi:hypothetical protein